jgi:hypothetical protein
MDLNLKQTIAIDFLEDKFTNELEFGGAAGGGKSILGCYWQLKQRFKYPKTVGLIGRSKLKTLKETTLQSFFKVASFQGLKINRDYKYTGSSDKENPNCIVFRNGSKIILKDLFYYPSDPNFEELGSLEITDCFIDENSQITEKAWNIVRSRIRHNLDENNLIPKMLGTCNPSKNYVYTKFYKPFKEGKLKDNQKFIQSLVTDNPKISKHYIENLNQLDQKSKERLLHGNWEYDDDPSVLMEYEKIVDLFTNSFVAGGLKYITCDVARLGKDKSIIRVWDGFRCIKKVKLSKNRIDELAQVIRNLQREYSVPNQNTLCDEDGVGGGLVDILRCKGFVNNSVPFEINGVKTNYQNLRSQCYYELSKKVNSNEMYLYDNDIDDRNLITQELEQIKQIDIDKDGKIKIISRDEITKNIGRSPDEASTIMMRMYFEVSKVQLFKGHKTL